MSQLSSASTDAQVWAAYDDNASYAEDGDTAKCLIFQTACRMLLRRTPKLAALAGRGGHEIQMDVALLREELKAAERWYALANGTGRVTHLSLENYRR